MPGEKEEEPCRRISVIFFLDLGGTFRVIDEDPAYLAAARAKIAELCGVETENPTQWFADVIDKRYDQYREWALKYMCEAPEEVLLAPLAGL